MRLHRSTACALVILLAACKAGEAPPGPVETAAPAAKPSASQGASLSASASASASADSVKGVSKEIKTDEYTFAYSYPAAAAAIPALRAQLEAQAGKAQAEIAGQAQDGRREANADGREFSGYASDTGWTTVTDLPGWLSLLGTVYSYTGGAHGNHGTAALLWDKAANRERSAIDLFASKAAFDKALGSSYCAALNKERAKRRGEFAGQGGFDDFNRCIAPSEVTVLLGSADKAHVTRIGLIADPYVAGPYAEGQYEITLPVTPALIAAARPEYRALFAAGK